MKDFINPKSMVTPGVAGALVMFLANGLIFQFSIDKPVVPYVFLILSYAVGLFLLADMTVKGFSKVGLYMINSLIIFCMATGSNTVGDKVTSNSKTEIEKTIPALDTSSTTHNGTRAARMLFTSIRTFQDDSTAKLKELKSSLKNQLYIASNNIQLLQSELVTNQNIYNDPKRKLIRLNESNDRLLKINNSLKDEDLEFTGKLATKFQDELLEVQHNIRQFQGALIIEKRNASRKKRFFTDWQK